MLHKYFKPTSLTWWASLAPLLAGVVVATEPLHGLSEVVATVDNVTGHMSAVALINIGLGGIGLRGAMG